jgi:predicted phage terminase large subunit-like protein
MTENQEEQQLSPEEEQLELAAELERVEAEMASLNLKQFVYKVWDILEPSNPLKWNWHLDVICRELESITNNTFPEDSGLLINVPPGTMKSLLVSVLWPAWEWTRQPGLRYISASYGARLAIRDTMKMRDIIVSPWYSRVYGVGLSADQSAKPIWVGERVLTKHGHKALRDIVVGDEVLTHLGRFRKVNAVHEQGTLPVVTVQTKKGRAVVAAPDHPFLTTNGWILAENLSPGNTLIIPERVDPLDNSNEMSAEEARLIGYLVGDGSVGDAASNVLFWNNDASLREDFAICAKAVGLFAREMPETGHMSMRLQPSESRWSWARDGESPLSFWLKKHQLFNTNSYTKRIPLSVMQGGETALANFVGAYWSCDGSIYATTNGRYIAAAGTVSELLARDLHLALFTLGIDCDFRIQTSSKLYTDKQPRGYTSYEISASAQHEVAKFSALPILERKRKNAELAGKHIHGPRGHFRTPKNQDIVTKIVWGGGAECRCLTVEEDASFTVQGVAVHNSWFTNDTEGWRLATSTKGEGTGEHPDRLIIDDPHKADEARSDVSRQSVLDWYDRTISTRGVSRGVRRIIVMQRLHEEDLSAHVLTKGKWRHICFPMRFDPKRAHPDDPRREAGELLWPEMFDEDKVTALELALGPYGTAGQLQQQPAPEGGGLFKRTWFKILEEVPQHKMRRLRGWDTAATEGGGDWTVGVRIAFDPEEGKFFIDDVVRGQWSPRDVDDTMAATVRRDGKLVTQKEQLEPGSAGKMVIAKRARDLVGYDYGPSPTTGDKVTRAKPYRAQVEAGNVFLKKAPWNEAFLQEHEVFPNGKNDDIVDAASTAFNELVTGPRPIKVLGIRWG